MGAGFKVIETALKLNISGFTAPLGVATAQAKQFGTQASAGVKQFGTDLGKAATDGSGNLEKVGKASAVMGGALLLGFGLAAKSSMGFEQELSNLSAATGATSDEMALLRQQALDAGAATSFSASEAAQAQSELAKAGVSTADILGGALEGSLALAAAGSIDLAQAATLSANAMTTFGLKGADVGRIADTIAAGANKSAADVDQIGQALQQTGLVADQFGLSLEETVGVLSLFHQAGLKGSDAGTSMKTMLQRLIPQSDEAKETMESLGIEMFDAQGNFVGIDKAAQQLQQGLSGLTVEQRAAAMQTIFGADAIRAATILYEGGADGVQSWTDKVTDSGYAAEVAEEKLDNLAGDLEGLRGSIETVLIQGGSKANGTLRFLAQQATNTVNAFGELPSGVQSAGVAFAGVAGTAGVLIGGLGTLAPKVSATMNALRGMGGVGNAAANGLGAIGRNAGKLIPLAAGLAVAWQIYANRQAESKARTDELTAAMKQQADGVKGATDAALGKLLSDSNAAGAIEKIGADYEEFVNIIEQSGDELDSLWDSFRAPEATSLGYIEVLDRAAEGGSEVAESLQDMVAAGDLSEQELFQLVKILDQLSDEHDTATDKARRSAAAERDVGEAGAEGADGADELTGAMGAQAEATKEATEALQEHMDKLRSTYDPLFAYIDGTRDFTDAQNDVKAAEMELAEVRGNSESTTLDVLAAEQKLADAHDSVGTSAYELNFASIELRDAFENQGLTAGGARQAMYDWVIQAGGTREEAERLADDLAGVAEEKQNITDTPAIAGVSATGVPATTRDLRTVRDAAHNIPPRTTTATTTKDINAARTALWSVRDAANSIPGSRTVDISVRGAVAALQQFIGISNARGGIVEFAGGGMAVQSFAGGGENHIAQIARPGAMRLWAEPETGGEAYIPLANDWRRPRAVSVLDETASRFGLRVEPRNAAAGTTVVNHLSVPIHVSAEMSAMAVARMEDMAARAGKRAIAEAMAGVN